MNPLYTAQRCAVCAIFASYREEAIRVAVQVAEALQDCPALTEGLDDALRARDVQRRGSRWLALVYARHSYLRGWELGLRLRQSWPAAHPKGEPCPLDGNGTTASRSDCARLLT